MAAELSEVKFVQGTTSAGKVEINGFTFPTKFPLNWEELERNKAYLVMILYNVIC